MKYLIGLLFASFFLIVSSYAYAQEGWTITSFSSEIVIQSDGIVHVNETIVVDFSDLQKHGIFRDIPYVYEAEDGGKIYTGLKVAGVQRNNQPEHYQTFANGANIRIKIGDPKLTISGPQTYTITYLATGVLSAYDTFDELYWNVAGFEWPVLIKQVSARVYLPKEGILQLSCYDGVEGSTNQCQGGKVTDQEAQFSSDRQFSPGEGMTIAVGFTKGLVPILAGHPPVTPIQEIFSWQTITPLLMVVLIGFGFFFWRWWGFGRDVWIPFARRSDPTFQGEPVPIGHQETITPEFSPPENFRPAEIGVLVDEQADTLDISATIVDLAVRGYLTITEEPKTWLLGKADYRFQRKDKPDQDLLGYEKTLLNHVFSTGNTVRLSDLRNTFYQDLATVKEELYTSVTSKRLFVSNPESVRSHYSCSALVILVIGGLLTWFGLATQISLVLGIGGGLACVGVLGLSFSRIMPRRTAYGHELYRRAKGYEYFLSNTEKYRQPFFEKENIFMEILPYAMVFGVAKKLAAAFEQMGMKPPEPSWYVGTTPFNVVAFSDNIDSFSKTLSSAMSSSPSSSGSGGGGFSGGGFGGGGGGSW